MKPDFMSTTSLAAHIANTELPRRRYSRKLLQRDADASRIAECHVREARRRAA
jgi:hypothetical protein